MTPSEAYNPFELLINPEVVVKAMEASERLSRLRSRICRPLDRPTGAGTKDHAQRGSDIDSLDDAESDD